MMRNVVRSTIAATLTAIACAAVWAASAADGKWTWMQRGRGGSEVAVVLELKADGEKLAGTLTQGDRKDEIKEGMIKGSDCSFVIVRERQGQQRKTTYKGKIEGDKITGTRSAPNREGQEQAREWVATRAK